MLTLGFTGARDPRNAQISKSRRNAILDEMMESCREYIAGEFLAAFRVRCEEVLGPKGSWRLDVEPQDPNVVRFRYPPASSASLAYVTPQVVLDLGTHAEFVPPDRFAIRSFVAEELGDVDERHCLGSGPNQADPSVNFICFIARFDEQLFRTRVKQSCLLGIEDPRIPVGFCENLLGIVKIDSLRLGVRSRDMVAENQRYAHVPRQKEHDGQHPEARCTENELERMAFQDIELRGAGSSSPQNISSGRFLQFRFLARIACCFGPETRQQD